MAILIPDGTGAMVAPEDIRVLGEDGIWESVPSIFATAADGVMEQVWPERLYLYQEGDECTDITGGWISARLFTFKNSSYSSNSKQSNCLRISDQNGNHFDGWAWITAKIIDLRKYSKLCFEYAASSVSPPSGFSNIAALVSVLKESYLGGGKTTSNWDTMEAYAKKDYALYPNDNSKKIISLDISGVNEGIVADILLSFYYTSDRGTLDVYNIWLEP